MALVHISSTLGLQCTPMIEDPNPSANRIFLSGVAHEANYLTPQFNQTFHYQSLININQLQSTGYGNMQGNATTPFGGNLLANKGSIWTGRSAESSTNVDKEAWSAYHRSLDPVNYPAKRSWYTVNNRAIITYPQRDLYDATGPHNTYMIYTSDITSSTGAIFTSTAQGNNNFPNLMFYEDVANVRLWGLQTSNGQMDNVSYVTNYDNLLASNTTPLSNNNDGTTFFLGVDTGNNTWWVRDKDITVGDPYVIHRISPVGVISYVSTMAAPLAVGLLNYPYNATTYNYCRPSNVRYDSATSRVFYSSHFNGSNELLPIRYQWDPTNLNTSTCFTATTCTMVYSGVTAASGYTSRAAKYPNTGGANTGGAWHIKPWQFRPANTTTWYITFWLTDKANNTANASTRWSTASNRTMVTYSINTATDSTLTFHSTLTFSTAALMPRDFLPINSDGTQVVAPTTGQTNFYQFDTTQGWTLTNVYPYEMVSVGLDNQNRVWGVGKDGSGYYSVHMLTTSTPMTINIRYDSASYTYIGTNINTNAYITAFNSSGVLVASTLTLTVVGNSMIFTDSGTRNYTTTTNAVSGAVVRLTITGAGMNNIAVGANI
jgi:hypothetical protein